MGVFAKLMFPVGIFLIRNFSLRILKGNGNAANGSTVYLRSSKYLLLCLAQERNLYQFGTSG